MAPLPECGRPPQGGTSHRECCLRAQQRSGPGSRGRSHTARKGAKTTLTLEELDNSNSMGDT